MAPGARSGDQPPVGFLVDAPSNSLNQQVLQMTRGVWQPRIGRSLSSDEAQQIVSSIAGFFSILAEWERAEVDATHDRPGDTASRNGGRDDDC